MSTSFVGVNKGLVVGPVREIHSVPEDKRTRKNRLLDLKNDTFHIMVINESSLLIDDAILMSN